MLSFLSIPIAGYLGTLVVGRVDNLGSALLGGALVGAIVGTAQAFASRGRLRKVAWPLATAIGMSAGVALGMLAVGYRTGLGDLVVAGLITGAAVGVAQAIALPAGARMRWLWLPITAALWPLAWTITTLSGIKVDEQFIVFGASGAFVYTVLAGFALQVLVKTPVTPKAVSTPELIAH
jgi:hypothetical protein